MDAQKALASTKSLGLSIPNDAVSTSDSNGISAPLFTNLPNSKDSSTVCLADSIASDISFTVPTSFDGIVRLYLLKLMSLALESAKHFVELIYDTFELSKLVNKCSEFNLDSEVETALCTNKLSNWLIKSSVIGPDSDVDFRFAAGHMVSKLSKQRLAVSNAFGT